MVKNAQWEMLQSRIACEAAGAKKGEYTPIIFDRYELIGGQKGISLAYPSETIDGRACIIWHIF